MNDTRPSKITTHVLDTSLGLPAADVAVSLDRLADEQWCAVARARTNPDGRISDWLDGEVPTPGIYRITFETAAYFKARGRVCFYPRVQIEFFVGPDAEARNDNGATRSTDHYHIPLLLSGHGFTTYRGS